MKKLLKFFFTVTCLITTFNIISLMTSTPSEKDIERKIRVTCIIEIKNRLKHPGSMEIINRSVMPIGENEWVAEIGVKAKNNFGVMAPLNFVCGVHLEDGEYKLKTIRSY